MGKLLTYAEQTEEARRLAQEGRAKTYKEAIEIVKGYSQADKNFGDNHEKLIDTIIAPGENIDNGQIYSEATGETLRDLI